MNSQTAVWTGTGPGEYLSRTIRGALGVGLMSSPEVMLARRWDLAIAKLNALRALEDDWDGLGSEAPPTELIDSAEEMLTALRWGHPGLVPTRVIATPDANVMFEWQAGRMIMEAVIGAVGSASFVIEEPGQPTERWQATLEKDSQDKVWGILRPTI